MNTNIFPQNVQCETKCFKLTEDNMTEIFDACFMYKHNIHMLKCVHVYLLLIQSITG